FSSRRRHTRSYGDWSSDVCSSDLITPSPNWPVGVPAERSSDMAEKVKTDPGSIGYVELQYAVKGNISHGAVQNSTGKFVKASTRSEERRVGKEWRSVGRRVK